MSAAAKRAKEPRPPVNTIEVANLLVASRRAALDLTVNQVRELAAALLIYEQQLHEANRRMAAMMLAEDAHAPAPKPEPEPEPKVVHVPIVTGGNPQLSASLDALLKARWHLEQERHSAGENLARQKFEKAAIAVCTLISPKQRT